MKGPDIRQDTFMAAIFRLAKAEKLADIRTLYLHSMAYIGERMGIGQPSDAFSNLGTFIEGRNLYILEEDGIILAAAAMHEVDNGLYVDYLAVRKGNQGKGLGRHMLAELELIAESRELPHLLLHTPEVMAELLSYYERRGFRESHRALPPHGRDQILRVHFKKDISLSDLHMDPEHEHDRLPA